MLGVVVVAFVVCGVHLVLGQTNQHGRLHHTSVRLVQTGACDVVLVHSQGGAVAVDLGVIIGR